MDVDCHAALFDGPVKRSITIAGHQTSISLEPPFWQALEAAARSRSLPLSALVARIDAARVETGPGANLASALRCWLLGEAQKQVLAAPHTGTGLPAISPQTDR